MTWQPILAGALAEQAHPAISAIADCLADSIPPEAAYASPSIAARDASLESGRAGLALFYAYLDRAELGGGETAARLLDESLAGARTLDLGVSLCSGLAGLGWVAEHLGRLGVPEPSGQQEFQRHVEARLQGELDRAITPTEPDDYDLLYGLVGLGVFALERLPDPSARAILLRVVERLGALAERNGDLVTWWTPPALTYQAEQFPSGGYNLGLAHGVPAVVALLGLACRAGIAADLARPLLDGAVAWLLAQRLPADSPSAFPSWVGPGIEPRPSRLAWCYGDLGLAAALFAAARAVDEPDWERTALDLARASAGRPIETAHVVDAPLCHGAIGVGHIFNRFHQATGEPGLADAARFWMERGLAMRRPGGKLGGFHALMPADDATFTRRVAYRGIVNGAARIGLALLAATTDVEPAWDRILLLS